MGGGEEGKEGGDAETVVHCFRAMGVASPMRFIGALGMFTTQQGCQPENIIDVHRAGLLQAHGARASNSGKGNWASASHVPFMLSCGHQSDPGFHLTNQEK